MTLTPKAESTTPSARGATAVLWRSLASLKLAVILIIVLAVVLAWATFMEAAKGREYTQWYVYYSGWFIVLLGLLALNILAATLVRFPWKRSQIGFLVTHAGLWVLLAGSIQTFVAGVEGRLSVAEGESADSITRMDRSQITLVANGVDGHAATEFSFNAGPVDWRTGKALDFGVADGIGMKVLRFIRHARREVDWVADESGFEGPAIRYALAGSNGEPVSEDWLAAGRFGAETSVGPLRLALQPLSTDSMLKDFLEWPAKVTDEAGILSIHYDGHMSRLPVQENVGKSVPVGESDVDVEIIEYLPNARPAPGGRFVSRGDEPKNPMLELQVHLPDKDQPVRQVAFARHPLLNLNGVHGWVCPVRFYYHHAAVPVPNGVEFIQTSDDKLHCRIGCDGSYQQHGEVCEGDRVKVVADFEIRVVEYLPRARQEVKYRPVRAAPGDATGLEAAALVEVLIGGETRQFWLKRNDEQYGFHRVETPQGSMLVTFGYERLPLGFSLKFLDFTRGMNPGGMGDASFVSSVQLVDSTKGIDEKHEISMNHPLVHRKFAFYQSSFQEMPGGAQASVLSVAYDPGRLLKYLGSLMICVGIFVMSYTKGCGQSRFFSWFFRRRRAAADGCSSQCEFPRSPQCRAEDQSSRSAAVNWPKVG